MKATWGEISDEESEVEDGDNDNLALMDKSDTDSDNDSSELVNQGDSSGGVERVAAECFKLEREETFKNSTPVKLLNELVDSNQNGKVENVDWEDVFLLTDDNEWPSKIPQFKETMKEYRSELKKVAESDEVMDENLGLAKGYIKKAFNNNGAAFFGTKVSHYPPCPHPEKVYGLRAHTDAGGVILLFQDDQVDGLQILKDGQWIDVLPIPNVIKLKCLATGNTRVPAPCFVKTRCYISIASFYNPSLKATIAPALEELSSSNSATYPTFVFGNYMSVYNDQKFLPKEPRSPSCGVQLF
ncbi:Aconitate hydratase mitochondrial [Datura stramonium]|uniref:Aconitate hydratase mitochondrial n=1 Tax=Datura stramonium TaxID=4076 RepID=A0ABS8TLB2_DATST|nr:Aconitate hydratase mitochondrial [Datura stramonium]